MRNKRPEAVTLDVIMPIINGGALLLAQTANTRVIEITVIMLAIVDDTQFG